MPRSPPPSANHARPVIPRTSASTAIPGRGPLPIREPGAGRAHAIATAATWTQPAVTEQAQLEVIAWFVIQPRARKPSIRAFRAWHPSSIFRATTALSAIPRPRWHRRIPIRSIRQGLTRTPPAHRAISIDSTVALTFMSRSRREARAVFFMPFQGLQTVR